MAGACSVNNPSSLLTEFVRTHERASCLEIETRMSSEVKSILPLANRLIRLIEESRCVIGEEPAVEFGLELVDSWTAPVGITLFRFDDRMGEFCARPFRAGFPSAIR